APMRPSPTPTAVGRAGARVGEPGGHRASRARAGRPSREPDGHRGSWKRAGEPGAGRRAGAGEPGPAGGGGVAWLAREVEETCSGVTGPTGKFTRGYSPPRRLLKVWSILYRARAVSGNHGHGSSPATSPAAAT